MNPKLRRRLIEVVEARLSDTEDPAHDFNHAFNVMRNAEVISRAEGADRDVTIPAGLLHDLVHYLPNDPRSDRAPGESAQEAATILNTLEGYPRAKIPRVKAAIVTHSPWLPAETGSLEARVVRDADLLESTGALAIMRTFACAGAMKLPLYSPHDPFCVARPPERLRFALDYVQMTEISRWLQTDSARHLAGCRMQFLNDFLVQLREELDIPVSDLARMAAAVEPPAQGASTPRRLERSSR
jgi:uncharacterized protein